MQSQIRLLCSVNGPVGKRSKYPRSCQSYNIDIGCTEVPFFIRIVPYLRKVLLHRVGEVAELVLGPPLHLRDPVGQPAVRVLEVFGQLTLVLLEPLLELADDGGAVARRSLRVDSISLDHFLSYSIHLFEYKIEYML